MTRPRPTAVYLRLAWPAAAWPPAGAAWPFAGGSFFSIMLSTIMPAPRTNSLRSGQGAMVRYKRCAL